MPEQLSNLIPTLVQLLTEFALKFVGSLVLWVVGGKVIKFALGLLSKALTRSSTDPTLIKYLISSLDVLLQVILVLAILGIFGIQTTSFAALLAAAGVAIGAAWGGLLANFAAGAFMIWFRPFRVGDFVSAGGITGTVEEIGLFVSKIVTMDNVVNIVGNNKIFADNIQNYSANPYRRVELLAQLNHSVNAEEAMKLLRERVAQIPNVVTNPAPEIDILEFNLAGPVLAVRPYCNNLHYWQVYFDTNKVICQAFGEAGYPVPEQHYHIRREG